MTASDLAEKRIGVVLCGGGAKGAYHIGCWKALRAAGLDRVRAISGSSVGAINAVFIASGRLDAAEHTWRTLRVRDVVGLRLRSAFRLPLWLFAALGSEFSPFKITRLSDRVAGRHRGWVHAVACALLSVALWEARGLLPATRLAWAPFIAAIPLALAALTLAHRLTRPVFLDPFVTDNMPLARTIAEALTDDDLQKLRAAELPIYGVVSHYVPGVRGSHRWGGWGPMYVRLDQAESADALVRTLLAGSAVPGFLPVGSIDGRPLLDGAWTDNVPAGPLLFSDDLDLDVIFVVYLKQRVRHTPRHNSRWGTRQLLVRDAVPAVRPNATLLDWARCRWETYCAAGAPGIPGTPAAGSAGQHAIVVPVSPSERVGNFFTGTLWFSRRRSAALIDLGERDMRAALERLGRGESLETAAATPLRTRRGTRAVAPRPVPASFGPSIPPALWPSPDQPAAE